MGFEMGEKQALTFGLFFYITKLLKGHLNLQCSGASEHLSEIFGCGKNESKSYLKYLNADKMRGKVEN